MTDQEIFELAYQCATTNDPSQNYEFAPAHLLEFARALINAEREACAATCDGWLHADGDRCAEAIRARD